MEENTYTNKEFYKLHAAMRVEQASSFQEPFPANWCLQNFPPFHYILFLSPPLLSPTPCSEQRNLNLAFSCKEVKPMCQQKTM